MMVTKYIIFAGISTVINLLFQYLSFMFYSGDAHLYIAIFMGTLAGLVVKYILDKNFIFYHVPKDRSDDAQKFMMYTFMGFFTTIIFWATEILFDYYFKHSISKYIGAVVGLSIGYVIKYFLDKKFVFIDNQMV
ncbi:MAG: GtrA family protein [Alcanivoracaceae bacterium]|nr:GtrA family protein [Alcanivoracaceae bacterium]